MGSVFDMMANKIRPATKLASDLIKLVIQRMISPVSLRLKFTIEIALQRLMEMAQAAFLIFRENQRRIAAVP